MNAPGEYLIRIGAAVEESELNAAGPLAVVVVGSDEHDTLLSVRTDQSGLMGLLRHLHGLGFVLLSMTREQY